MICTLRHSLRVLLSVSAVSVIWLATERAAHAQGLVAQTGAAKTGVGYGLLFLAVILALVAVCRPSGRQWQYTEEELREIQAKKQGQIKRQAQ